MSEMSLVGSKLRAKHAGTSKHSRDKLEDLGGYNVMNAKAVLYQATESKLPVYELKRKEIEECVNGFKHKGQHTLATEIDQSFHKVSDCLEEFEESLSKYKGAFTTNQREKIEMDLKKEMKKIQRQRDQIKLWLNDSTIKEKELLQEMKLIIETQMERYKTIERECKAREYSDYSLNIPKTLSPLEEEEKNLTTWLSESIQLLQLQIDKYEANIGAILDAKKKKLDREQEVEMERLKKFIAKHKGHIERLEMIMRIIANFAADQDMLATFLPKVSKIKDDLDYYLHNNGDPQFADSDIQEYLYEEIEEVEKECFAGGLKASVTSLAPVIPPPPPPPQTPPIIISPPESVKLMADTKEISTNIIEEKEIVPVKTDSCSSVVVAVSKSSTSISTAIVRPMIPLKPVLILQDKRPTSPKASRVPASLPVPVRLPIEAARDVEVIRSPPTRSLVEYLPLNILLKKSAESNLPTPAPPLAPLPLPYTRPISPWGRQPPKIEIVEAGRRMPAKVEKTKSPGSFKKALLAQTMNSASVPSQPVITATKETYNVAGEKLTEEKIVGLTETPIEERIGGSTVRALEVKLDEYVKKSPEAIRTGELVKKTSAPSSISSNSSSTISSTKRALVFEERENIPSLMKLVLPLPPRPVELPEILGGNDHGPKEVKLSDFLPFNLLAPSKVNPPPSISTDESSGPWANQSKKFSETVKGSIDEATTKEHGDSNKNDAGKDEKRNVFMEPSSRNRATSGQETSVKETGKSTIGIGDYQMIGATRPLSAETPSAEKPILDTKQQSAPNSLHGKFSTRTAASSVNSRLSRNEPLVSNLNIEDTAARLSYLRRLQSVPPPLSHEEQFLATSRESLPKQSELFSCSFNSLQCLQDISLFNIMFHDFNAASKAMAKKVIEGRGWRCNSQNQIWFIRKGPSIESTCAYERGSFYYFNPRRDEIHIINDFIFDYALMSPIEKDSYQFAPRIGTFGAYLPPPYCATPTPPPPSGPSRS